MDVDYSPDDDMELENAAPAPKKAAAKGAKQAGGKKASAASGGAGALPLGPSNAANAAGGGDAAGGKAIEQIYQKKTQLEHILLRPDTYIGSTEKQQQQLWVHDGERMVCRPTSYVPGLYKIFDEILVNAADNKVRDPSMDTLRVTIDSEGNFIQVWNNGNGIPVEVHKEEGVYVPELIFGHLLTSSNYDDNEKKVTGGRNGYGAKLANIFSTEFTIETCDGQRQRKYKQVFKDNMSVKGEPKITACKPGENWTAVSFRPDLAKFGMQELEADAVALMRKRVYDLAGVLGKTCKVYLNGERLQIKSFLEYVELYLGPKDQGPPRVYERINDRWEVCVSPTDGCPQQVSFVNSICTIKGGTHVTYVADQVIKGMIERIIKKSKAKDPTVKPFMVRNHLWVFLNCLIENPAFDSQTKETLTLRASSFGSKCELPGAFLDKVAKSGLVDAITRFATTMQAVANDKELKKSDGSKRQRILGIPKLDDANDAGGRNSHNCTLILTEGDSAKALAVSGLSVVGRDQYGVFPLRGKLLNVREASASQVTGNVEIQAIKQILGLQHGKAYSDVKTLRYGHLMIMTDQDHDGSHIKGLIMNFFHTLFPTLLKVPGFLLEFITPIIKASKGRQRKVFYTMPEYEAWKESLGGSTVGWSVKYYKGLGTSTREEAREYFAAIQQHRKQFVWHGDADGQAIEMAFSKKKVDDRKEWLSGFVPGTFLDNSASNISYSDFIHKELILFSRADLERSIPSMVDGLKPGQRKIIFACFKRNLRKDIKVAQLAGYVSEHAAYHHGEASLASTIVNLAQDFVGSNNINLLVPSGQFGTRLQGGKDAASPRYIFTRLAPLARHVFNEADDQLLKYLNEEGQNIEPEWYMPILPMVLVNGAEGIGTGWSTYIPNYNPRDIVDNIKRLLDGQEQVPMQPWYRGFRGSITEVPSRSVSRSFACSGIIAQTDEGGPVVEVLELPVRKWTQDYKEFLEGLVKPENKEEEPLLVDFKEHHTDVTVHFVLSVAPDRLREMGVDGLESKLKLTTKFSTSNMMLFDKDGLIKHYPTPEHIVAEFCDLRLEYYEKRRQALLKAAERELLRLSNRVRFILAVISGELRVSNRKKAEVEQDLQAQGYDRLPNTAGKGGRGAGAAGAGEPAGEEDDEQEDEVVAAGGSYDYLLSMPIYSLTLEKVQAAQQAAQEQAARVAYLASTSAKAMWHEDLDAFVEAFNVWEAEEEAAAQKLVNQQRGARGGGKGGATKALVIGKSSGAAAKAGGGGGAGSSKAAAKPAKKSKKAASSEEEDEEDDWSEEDDEDDFMSEGDDDDDVQDQKKTKKPAAGASKPRAAPAPAAAAAAGPSKPAAAGPSKPPAAAPSSAAAAFARATAAAAKVAAPAPAAAGPSSSDGLSLEARLAGRFQKLTMVPPASTTTSASGAAAGSSRASGAQAGSKGSRPSAKVAVVEEEEDEDEDDVRMAQSPAPAALAQKKAARAAKGEPVPAAAKRKPAAPPAPAAAAAVGTFKPAAAAAAKPQKAAGAKAGGGTTTAAGAAAKGGAKKKRAVTSESEEDFDSEDEEEGSDAISIRDTSDDDDVFVLEAPSPAVAPKGKKSKVGPSPVAFKTQSKTAAGGGSKAAAGGGSKAAAPAGKAAAAVKPAAPAPAPAKEEEEEEEEAGPSDRPQRARRAVKNVSYVQIKDSDEEDEDAEEDSGDDFDGSDDDDDE